MEALGVRIIVIYDVPVEYDYKRSEIREYLKNYGGVFRQYSVYEVELTGDELGQIAEELSRIVKGVPCKIEIVAPCRRCYESIRQVGGERGREW